MAKSKKGKGPEATYYFDACVLLHLIEQPKTDPFSVAICNILADAENGRFDVVTSVISIVEVLYAKSERAHCAVDKATEEAIKRLWHPNSPIRLVEVHELIARDALALLRAHIADGWFKTGGRDGVHLATAKREGATEFFSIGPEKAMKKWEKYFPFKVVEPHYEPPVVEPSMTEDETTAAKIAASDAASGQSHLFPTAPPASGAVPSAGSQSVTETLPAEPLSEVTAEVKAVPRAVAEIGSDEFAAQISDDGVRELPIASAKDSHDSKNAIVEMLKSLDKAGDADEDQEA